MPDDTAVTRAELLAVVERSPAAVGAHERAHWVGLFGTNGVVEDPVGSRPHQGLAALERFYDTFIGPRDITFHRDTDLVVGATVLRDLELEVRMSPTLVLRIPAYLRYDVDTGGDQLKIARLQAHWELPAMVMQFGRGGRAAVPAGLAMTRALLANQGVSGTVGFLSGFGGVGNRGKRLLTALLVDACAGDEVAVRRRFTPPARITRGDGARLVTSELASRLDGARWRKMIAAGDTVTVAADRDGRRSVLIAQLRSRPLAISRLRLFSEE